ncbi:Transcriptional regulatory protein sin3 [Oleoguttula sp. CCFEE 5521]
MSIPWDFGDDDSVAGGSSATEHDIKSVATSSSYGSEVETAATLAGSIDSGQPIKLTLESLKHVRSASDLEQPAAGLINTWAKSVATSEVIIETSTEPMLSPAPGRITRLPQDGDGPGDMEQRGPVDHNYAVKYVNKIKDRFSAQPDIYKQFIEILQTYQRESVPLPDVYSQITHLFRTAPDLSDEFKQFLPESAAAARAASEAVNGDTTLDSQTEVDLGLRLSGEDANKSFSLPVPPPPESSRPESPRGMNLPGYDQHSQPVPSSASKRHKCPYCSTDFTRLHNLKSHLLTHAQEKPYICQTCSARFRRLHDLERHTKLHTGERPHTCPKCGRRFARGDALARHTKVEGGCVGKGSSSDGDDQFSDQGENATNDPMDSENHATLVSDMHSDALLSTASPSLFDPRPSIVAGPTVKKRNKPLPPIVVDESDSVALARARNTAAARKSRAKKAEQRDVLEGRVADREVALPEDNGESRLAAGFMNPPEQTNTDATLGPAASAAAVTAITPQSLVANRLAAAESARSLAPRSDGAREASPFIRGSPLDPGPTSVRPRRSMHPMAFQERYTDEVQPSPVHFSPLVSPVEPYIDYRGDPVEGYEVPGSWVDPPPFETSSEVQGLSTSEAAALHTNTSDEVESLWRLPYTRSPRSTIPCNLCPYPFPTFRGEHELRRHQDRQHTSPRLVWICVHPASSTLSPRIGLDTCKQCSQRKEYSVYYNAGAHLLRAHFDPPQGGRRAGGARPSMTTLKAEGWMQEVVHAASADEALEDNPDHLQDHLAQDQMGSSPVSDHLEAELPKAFEEEASEEGAFEEPVSVSDSDAYGQVRDDLEDHHPEDHHPEDQVGLRPSVEPLEGKLIKPSVGVGSELDSHASGHVEDDPQARPLQDQAGLSPASDDLEKELEEALAEDYSYSQADSETSEEEG